MAEDEPFFPPPGVATKATIAGYRTPAEPAPTPRPAVVHRPAEQAEAGGPSHLSREEMRALIAVTAATAPRITPRKRAWRRGRVILLPFGIAETAAHVLLGSAAPWVMTAFFLAGVAWVARPLLRKNDFADVD